MGFQLNSDYRLTDAQQNAVDHLKESLKSGSRYQTLLGVTGSGKTFTMANLIQQTSRPAILMAPNKTLAAQLYAEMKEFFPNNAVEYFVSYYDYYQPEAYVPSSDTFIEKDAAVNEHIEQMRLSATKSMLQRDDVIIVATVSAIYGLGDPDLYQQMVLELKVGEAVGQRAIIKKLVELQYRRESLTLGRAGFRVRGDVIDIHPAEHEAHAIRVHLFDDEIEKIEQFDPLTGEIYATLQTFTCYPKTHYVTPRAQVLSTVEKIKTELATRVAYFREHNKLIEAQRIEQRCQYDMEMMLELGYCSGIENYSRLLANREQGQPSPTLMDYCPSNTLLLLDESHVMVPQIGAMYAGDRSRKMNLVDYGFRLPSALDNRPLMFQEFENIGLQTVFVSATPGKYENQHVENPVELVVRPTGLLDPLVQLSPAKSQVDHLYGEITKVVGQGSRVLVTTLTKKMSEQLTDYLSDKGVRVRYLHSSIDTVERVEILRDLRLGSFDVLVGINLLREGLDLPEVELVAVLDADKEGFLRSTTSLIQTIGRAARNLNGRVILYADRVTKSMQQAMDETSRRREIQKSYNESHGLTPQAIRKAVRDSLNVGGGSPVGQSSDKISLDNISQQIKTDEPLGIQEGVSFEKQLKQLESEMKKRASQLDFEAAADIRDQIAKLKQRWLGHG